MVFCAPTAWLFSARHINSFQPASFSLQRQQNPHNFLSNEGNLLEAHRIGEVLPGAHASAGWFHPDVLVFCLGRLVGFNQMHSWRPTAGLSTEPRYAQAALLCVDCKHSRGAERRSSPWTPTRRRRSPSCVHKPLSVSESSFRI